MDPKGVGGHTGNEKSQRGAPDGCRTNMTFALRAIMTSNTTATKRN